MTTENKQLEPGTELFSVATGRLAPLRKASRDAAKFMGECDGFYGVHITPEGGLLWFYETLNDAKVARNRAEAKGIVCGRNICRFVIGCDGVPEFKEGVA